MQVIFTSCLVSFEIYQCDWYNGLSLTGNKLKANKDSNSLEIFFLTVGGVPFPSVFHPNNLSPKRVNSRCLGLDQCKFQLLVPVCIWRMFVLVLGNVAKRSGRFCSQMSLQCGVYTFHTIYFSEIRYPSFTFRFIFFCI